MHTIAFRTTVSLDPADSITYYWGLDGLQPTATAADHRDIQLPAAAIISSARVTVRVAGTLGSGEAVPVHIYNVTANDSRVLGSATWAATSQVDSSASLNLPVAAGAAFLFRFVAPAWATNPTQVTIESVIIATDDAEETAIVAQDSGISDNAAAILTNDSDISANLAARIANDSDISANLAAILTNDSDISANVVAIAQNDSEILVNDSAISANVVNITQNDSEILVNDSAISSNLAQILTNDSDISALVAEQLTQDSSISANLAAIITNDSDISSNQAQILTNDSDISANLALVVDGDLTDEEYQSLRSYNVMRRSRTGAAMLTRKGGSN